MLKGDYTDPLQEFWDLVLDKTAQGEIDRYARAICKSDADAEIVIEGATIRACERLRKGLTLASPDGDAMRYFKGAIRSVWSKLRRERRPKFKTQRGKGGKTFRLNIPAFLVELDDEIESKDTELNNQEYENLDVKFQKLVESLDPRDEIDSELFILTFKGISTSSIRQWLNLSKNDYRNRYERFKHKLHDRHPQIAAIILKPGPRT